MLASSISTCIANSMSYNAHIPYVCAVYTQMYKDTCIRMYMHTLVMHPLIYMYVDIL